VIADCIYINGDSWLAHFASRVANSQHPLFQDKFVVNHAIPGSSNLEIISRTAEALEYFKQMNIKPKVIVGLSVVGRDLETECALAKPQTDLTEYIKSILEKEVSMLRELLKGYSSYICTLWTTNIAGTKSIIDFIDEDWSGQPPVYSFSNGFYNWLNDRKSILKFTTESFVETLDNKQSMEKRLLANKYIDDTLHLDKQTSDVVYERFFKHVLEELQ
jgi:hypothetical protein